MNTSLMSALLLNGFAGIPTGILALLALALLVSSLGFYRTGYFISIGYAFAITAMTVVAVAIGVSRLSWVSILQNIGLVLWSLRLGVYLLQRDRQATYRQAAERTYQSTAGVKLRIKFAIWISVSLLYVAMFSPSLFVLSNTSALTPFAAIISVTGIMVMFGGFALESVADKQKSDFKTRCPGEFCNTGLYKWVRCPNYLGEILFWVGNWIIGAAFYTSILQWLISFAGVACIALIMIGSTKRLERSQADRYGSLEAYQSYTTTIPVLFPFVRVYTLKGVRVYLE